MIRDELDKASDEAFAIEMEHAHKEDMEKKDRETMTMVMNHIFRLFSKVLQSWLVSMIEGTTGRTLHGLYR